MPFKLRRHRHLPKRYHTSRVLAEVTFVILTISIALHFSNWQPCGGNNPITWIVYLFSPDQVKAHCAAHLIENQAAIPKTPGEIKVNFIDITGVKINETQYQQLFNKYQHYIPKNRKIRPDDLKRLPPEAKALCNATCRMLVHKYLDEQK